MPKFFIDKKYINAESIEITGDNALHIATVLRAQKGDIITICDGQGKDYICEISEIEKKFVKVNINESFINENESNIKITLYQAIPKSDKMEMAIQKCVEIGVDRIVPVQTENTVVKIEGKHDKKISRWNKISESAAKQCGRGKIPVVENLLSFKDAVLDSLNLDGVIIPYEKEKENSMSHFVKNFKGKSIGVFIGPEGGFSDNEIKIAKENNFFSVTLGKRILRTETAGLVTSVILLYELEEMS